MRWKLLAALSLIGALHITTAAADQPVREVSWAELRDTGRLAAGPLTAGAVEPDGSLRITSPAAGPQTFELLVLDAPPIRTLQYGLTGKVRYEGLSAPGYLEMWNHFADGGFYFSRTMADAGPMQRLEGSSGWRDFALPFYSSKGAGQPTKLVLNLVLPGGGTVWLSPLALHEYEASELTAMLVAGRPGWWDDRTGGIVGAVLGCTLGLAGGLIGLLAGMGLARRTVLALLWAMIAVGAVLLVAGLAALVCSQPYAVCYPLLLCGVIAPVVSASSLPGIRRRYEQVELRRMAALDVPM